MPEWSQGDLHSTTVLPWGFSLLGKRVFLKRVVLGVVPARFRRSQQRSYLSSIAFLSLQRGCAHALTEKGEGLCVEAVVPEGLKQAHTDTWNTGLTQSNNFVFRVSP